MRAGGCCGGQFAQQQAVMAKDDIPRPDAEFQGRQDNFAAYVNDYLGDLRLVVGVMGAEIWRRVAWASRPRGCARARSGNRSVTPATADFFNSAAAPVYCPRGAGAGVLSWRDGSLVTPAAHAE